LVQIGVPGKPRRSRGVPGSVFGLKPKGTGPKISSQTAFKYPDRETDLRHFCEQLDRTVRPVASGFDPEVGLQKRAPAESLAMGQKNISNDTGAK